ncbi:MAG: class I SAM-dependent methyltransferase [Deltaproteobacteria bacterium]|nr:class I SAM-dependent methyltransferase [Deltaproteobacteria bacterium]
MSGLRTPRADRPAAVRPEVYDAAWVEEMGGGGSNRAFRESAGRVLRPRLARALALADLRPGLTVLDIGCGRGEVVFRACSAGASVAVGVDYAAASLGSARDNLQALAGADGSAGPWGLAGADAKRLPFRDEAFDRVFLLDVVEHLHEWELQEVWSEVRRVLRHDGFALVHTLPNRWAMDYGYRLARLAVPSLPASPPDKRDLFHVNEQSPPSLARSLARGGFASRIWLEDLTLPQARFLAVHRLEGAPELSALYRRLLDPRWGALYRLACRLPTRLFLVTDLFALAWRPDGRPRLPAALPANGAERLACILGRLAA